MRRAARFLVAFASLAAPPGARGSPFPARGGESGLLDVPDAETSGQGGGYLYGEIRFDEGTRRPADFGPLPLSLVVGLFDSLDAGLSLREWGRAGDPWPSPLLLGAAAKIRFLPSSGLVPALALDLTLDRLNWKAIPGSRLIASTGEVGRLRFAGFLGGEGRGPRPYHLGLTAGLAVSIVHRSDLETVLQLATSPRGSVLGGAFRWSFTGQAGASLGLDWLPGEKGVRLSLGFGFSAPPPGKRKAARPAEPVPVAAPPAPPMPAAPVFLDERPRLRLRIPQLEAPGGRPGPGHRQYGPTPAREEALRPARPATPEEARAARIAGAEAEQEAREKRLRALGFDQAARGERIAAEAARLEATEQDLALRERQLEGREKRTVRRGRPGPAEREAASREAQHRRAERSFEVQEGQQRARAAAAGAREAQARAREASLRPPADRLRSSLAREKAGPRQLDLREQLLAARERQAAAQEARLAAGRQRLEILERANALRADRLEAVRRRQEARQERLAAMRAVEPPPPAAPRPRRRPAGGKPALVMVVKPPTSIVKSARPGEAAPAAAPPALHPGVAVEKAVVAAGVVYFPIPGVPMRELDRESVENIATLAARERLELLVWARAQSPDLMPEAARRAEEVKLLALRVAALGEKQVVIRITTRPSVAGVDVVVSALREQPATQAAPAPAQAGAPAEAGAPAQAGAPAGAGARAGAAPPAALQPGETGKRQIREAVLSHRASIEECVEAELARRKLESAEAVLRLTVDRQGRVSRVESAREAALGGVEMERCLEAAAGSWKLPAGDAEYVVEIPITAVGAGGGR